jgi:hypothetical protein
MPDDRPVLEMTPAEVQTFQRTHRDSIDFKNLGTGDTISQMTMEDALAIVFQRRGYLVMAWPTVQSMPQPSDLVKTARLCFGECKDAAPALRVIGETTSQDFMDQVRLLETVLRREVKSFGMLYPKFFRVEG